LSLDLDSDIEYESTIYLK